MKNKTKVSGRDSREELEAEVARLSLELELERGTVASLYPGKDARWLTAKQLEEAWYDSYDEDLGYFSFYDMLLILFPGPGSDPAPES